MQQSTNRDYATIIVIEKKNASNNWLSSDVQAARSEACGWSSWRTTDGPNQSNRVGASATVDTTINHYNCKKKNKICIQEEISSHELQQDHKQNTINLSRITWSALKQPNLTFHEHWHIKSNKQVLIEETGDTEFILYNVRRIGQNFSENIIAMIES